MNKKGFTLIELLGVVTLIVLVSLIVIPNFLSSINKKRGEISSANMQLLASAADVYIDNHSGMYANSFEANGSTYCIPLQTLIDAGILETPFKDASGNEVDYSSVVKATYDSSYNGFHYEFVKKNACTEIIQYVSRPEIVHGMIPVVYEDGVWKKADESSKWYNYSDKKWANAVLVREWKGSESGSKSRYEYLEAPAGTTILESDILAYFVWIPRFRYQLFDSNTPVSINISFESVGTPKSLGTVHGEWLTHPAFSSNGTELSGIWVGKYETGNLDNNPIIMSNKTPWINIDYNSVLDICSSMIFANNIYGLSNVNTHLIKNSEWSAVNYLAYSVYGSGQLLSSTNISSTGLGGSTSGNEYGIYDMDNLSKEFVMLSGENDSSIGYSLSETSSWGGSNIFITPDKPILLRGNSSIFDYTNSYVKNDDVSFRIALINNDQFVSAPQFTNVIFDSCGGSIDLQTKGVIYNKAYGDLPTPVRSGFDFVGWTGKNLFDKTSASKYSLKYIRGDGSLVNSNEYSVYEIVAKPNATYTITNSGGSSAPGYVITDSSGNVLTGSSYSSRSSVTFTTPSTAAFIQFSVVTQSSSSRYDKDFFQIELGSSATAYDQFAFIDKNTIVTNFMDHTLYAKWIKN